MNDIRLIFKEELIKIGFLENDAINIALDAGSSTTGIAANLANRRYLGIDQEEVFLTISKYRKLEIENPQISATYRQKIGGFNDKKELELFLVKEPKTEYKTALNL